MPRRRWISREVIAGILAALEERDRSDQEFASIAAIARHFGVSRHFVRQVASGERRPDEDRPMDPSKEITDGESRT